MVVGFKFFRGSFFFLVRLRVVGGDDFIIDCKVRRVIRWVNGCILFFEFFMELFGGWLFDLMLVNSS